MTDQTERPATTYAVVVSDPGYFTGLDCIQHLTPDLDEARAVAACDLGDRVDIYRIFPDHYEWVETFVENRLISDVGNALPGEGNHIPSPAGYLKEATGWPEGKSRWHWTPK